LASSYQDFRSARRSIAGLGISLVLVSAATVALVAYLVIPNLPFAAALVLGAAVAPPDAVAAASVGRRLGLPRRVTTLLTGESLINDATSLTLYKVALAGVATGAWALTDGLGVFALAVTVGVGLGLAFGYVVHRIRMRLDDAVVASAFGLLTPFAAYWAAEQLGGSGVLAVVTAGLYLGHSSPEAGFATRLYEEPLWSTFDLVLESFTFALIGVQLKWVIADVIGSDHGLRTAATAAAAVLAAVLLVRPLYVFAAAGLSRIRLPGSRRPPRDSLSVRESKAVSWAGMRGVVTLAAAAAIPVTSGGAAFPARATLQLVAYTVAIGTLLIQGLTLPWVIRRLGLGSEEDEVREANQEAELRILTTAAAAAVLQSESEALVEDIGEDATTEVTGAIADAIDLHGETAATVLDPSQVPDGQLLPPVDRGLRIHALRRETVAAQRAVLMRKRDAGDIDVVVMRRMLKELDLEEESMSASWLNRI
jgi:Na+/H+ antiporter